MAKLSMRGWGKLAVRATKDRRGNVAPMFAVLAVPLLVAAGASVDIARTLDVRAQAQDLADSAALAGAYQFTSINTTSSLAAANAAEKYVLAMAPNLPNHPTLSAAQTPQIGIAACTLTAPAAPAPGTYTYQICTTGAGAPNYVGQVQVSIAYNVKTTLGAIITPAIATNAIATAQGGVARTASVSVGNFNSDASDLNQVFYYAAPVDNSGNLLTDGAMYRFDPSTTAPTPAGGTSAIAPGQCPMMSNAPTTKCPSAGNNTVFTFQVPYGSRPAFALYNTTGGVNGYGANGYGQAQGTMKKYFSTRAQVPTTAPTTTIYYDYQSAAFKYGLNGYGDAGKVVTDTPTNDSYTQLGICTVTTTTSSTTNTYSHTTTSGSGFNKTIKTTTDGTQTTTTTTTTASGGSPNTSTSNSYTGSQPGSDTVTQTSTNPQTTTSACQNTNSYSVANYIFPWGHPRNPLRYGANTAGVVNTDCTVAPVIYQWDDNGGTSDDNDFNDAVFTVTDCSTTGVLASSVRLMK